METQSELQLLKARAKLMGVDHSPNIGLETLRTKLKAAQEPEPEVLTDRERQRAEEAQVLKDATQLVRVIVTCNDTHKQKGERQGEIKQASNAVVGAIKKFVPYGHPTHLEQILVNVLEESKFQQRYGKGNLQHRMVKEYQIEYLPPLTVQEVEELKKQQALRAEAVRAEL